MKSCKTQYSCEYPIRSYKQNKQRIVLLSDLWGKEKSNWIVYYTNILEKYFDVVFYDSCDIGNVDKSDYSKEKLHEQFIAGGIQNAVEYLLEKEKGIINILAFSIGGFIAWKACHAGLKAQHLFAISATRLRHETHKPDGTIELIYGENDTYKPDQEWFQKLEIKEDFYKNEAHEFYKKQAIAQDLCRMIIEKIRPS